MNLNKTYLVIIILCVIALLSWSISCSGIKNNSNTRDSESVLYMLQYNRYSGLYCYIKMQEEYLDIKMYINGEIVSERDAPGYTYIPAEYIPAELFELEVRIFNVNDKLIHQEIYYNVSVINAEGKTKLEISSPDIEHLFIYNCKSIEDISALEETLKLKGLYLKYGDTTIDLISIMKLTDLKVLDIFHCNIKNINALSNLKNLEFLNIGSAQVEDITALKDLKNLRYLVMHHNKISDISPLSGLTNLEYLQASSNNIENVESLRNMRKLEYLVLAGNKVSDVEPLGEIISLKRVSLADNRIKDITPLSKLENLYYLNLSKNEIEDYSAIDELGIEYVK